MKNTWSYMYLILRTHLWCVVFTLNRSFYPTSVHPVSVLTLRPTDTNSVVTDCEAEKPKQPRDQGKASEMLAYLVREHNKTNQTRKIKK